MDPTLLFALSIIATCVSCGAAVLSIVFQRRSGDAALKGDVSELTILVERLAKAERRERMSRVRSGRADSAAPEGYPVPPGAENLDVEKPQAGVMDKNELRRMVNLRGIKR